MQKLFIDFTPEEIIYLDEEQSRHIAKSLRMKTGDMLMLSCGDGNDYGCIIEEINAGQVVLKRCYRQANGSEPDVRVHIFQGVPKGDKLDDVIQKCTELGMYELTPVLTHRSVSRPDAKAAAKKQARYQKIALEAAQQSGRGIVPEIHTMCTLSQAVAMDNSELKILFYEGGGEPLKDLVKKGAADISVYIGPEGGFEQNEVELIRQSGGKIASLGPRILRTQTAPTAALAAIMLLTDNM